MLPSRRLFVAGALAAAGCDQRTEAAEPPQGALPPLKSVAPFPLGVAAMTGQLNEPAFRQLLVAQFGQVTAEWEMKMESILREDGAFDFRAADAFAGFAASAGLRLHGHTLIWYAQDPVAFRKLDGRRDAFAAAYRNYILAVAGRYRGRAAGWDVVNEPITEDGSGLRDCVWRRNLGDGYVAAAFRHAQEADPAAVLILNDYDLETRPAKRRRFLRLAEDLLKSGAPLGGLGTQMHLTTEVEPAAVAASMRDLARLGLPIHVSELDVSTREGGRDRAERQARIVGAVGEAMARLPERQRYALTIWGLRDRDSWLRRPPNAGDGSDRPLLFDDAGRPKVAAAALVRAATA